ncbi:DUF305 domain-containing protein [Streptomyces sp. NPDC006529]|uniref:DUF305 domain-containing protein n=1 Tax=Streptomyces sp. NPDC006529 TaxID=3157177 RepID=UPI0033A00096
MPMTTERMTARVLHRCAGVVLATVSAFGLTACQGGGDDESAAGPVVIAPGRPGEQPRTLSPGQAARERPDDSPNAADRSYVRRMTEHHRQALTMSALAPQRASAEPVKRLAERIAAAQGPEIKVMESWLARYPERGTATAGTGVPAPGTATAGTGVPAPGAATGGPAPHDHGGAPMPGMATEQQLQELARASGPDFDRLFLRLMIAHHQGAVTMAGEALAGGNNGAVEEMANEVVAQQSAEVSRMRAMG